MSGHNNNECQQSQGAANSIGWRRACRGSIGALGLLLVTAAQAESQPEAVPPITAGPLDVTQDAGGTYAVVLSGRLVHRGEVGRANVEETDSLISRVVEEHRIANYISYLDEKNRTVVLFVLEQLPVAEAQAALPQSANSGNSSAKLGNNSNQGLGEEPFVESPETLAEQVDDYRMRMSLMAEDDLVSSPDEFDPYTVGDIEEAKKRYEEENATALTRIVWKDEFELARAKQNYRAEVARQENANRLIFDAEGNELVSGDQIDEIVSEYKTSLGNLEAGQSEGLVSKTEIETAQERFREAAEAYKWP